MEINNKENTNSTLPNETAKSRWAKFFVLTWVFLLVVQGLTILLSWIVSAVWPALGVHSLLSGSGLRWLLSSLGDNLASPMVAWFLLLSIFVGTFVWSGLPKKIIRYSENDYRDRFAVNFFVVAIFFAVILCVILAVYPHSSLLSVSGHLYPGPFLYASITILGFVLFGGSVVFCLLTGKVKDYETAEKACIFGLECAGPLIVTYILLKQSIELVLFAI